jgi:hypothetical protein
MRLRPAAAHRLAEIGKAGAGVLLYLNQEGRGIGIANKMRAYSLQDQGFDTVEANHRLGFEDDERDFRIGADILRRMGFGAVRLMTNNPRKVEMMEAEGITVAERVPLVTGTNRHNAHYLEVKKSNRATSCDTADMVLTPMGLRFRGRVFPCTSGAAVSRPTSAKATGRRLPGCTGSSVASIAPTAWRGPATGRCRSGPATCGPTTPATRITTSWSARPTHSAERLWRGDRLYDLILLTDWNWPRAERGRGSAIFLHRWRGPGRPTEGCVALARITCAGSWRGSVTAPA